MAIFIGQDEVSARAALEAAGVRIHAADTVTHDVDVTLCGDVLPAYAQAVRGEMLAPAPSDADADAGMGAWHVNDVDELHVVTSGEGIMEFITPDAIVAVLVTSGDVIEIRRAEHRYRPLTDQGWIIRHAAAADADMVTSSTGRAALPWPMPR